MSQPLHSNTTHTTQNCVNLLPSAIVCSCGVRFDSHFNDASGALDSALWLYLLHTTTALSSPEWTSKPHRVNRTLVACVFCSQSVDVDRYRAHLAQCRADGERLAIQRYRLASRSGALPSFECRQCLDDDRFLHLDIGTVPEHSHDSGSDPALELYVTCRMCSCRVAVDNAIAHVAFMHREHLSSETALAEMFFSSRDEFFAAASGSDELISRLSGMQPVWRDSSSPILEEKFSPMDNLPFDIPDPAAQPSEHDRNRIWNAARPFECTECGKCFSTRQHLQWHQVTHTGERLFECDNCGKRFMHKGHMQRHQMAHAPVRARSSGTGGGSRRGQVQTTIPPEAADYLFRQYKLDSKPTPEQLEAIASRTRLKERVVRVWYENARRRERKGEFNVAQQSIRKRCPGCRLRFTYRRALESHLTKKHADKFSRGEIHIDTLTDTDTERDDDSEPIITRSSGGGRKRYRTSFLPKQANYLFQQYKLDRYPAQEQLEAMASHTRLNQSVVQAWFRNARSRERKGTLNVAWQSIRKRCPVCRLRFTYHHALVKHLASKHADKFSRGEINIDTLAETESDGDSDLVDAISPSAVTVSLGAAESSRSELRAALAAPDLNDVAKIQLQECDECGMRFTSRQYLRRHERGHAGESVTQRPFECTECGKCFSIRHHLQRHQMTHTGERPLACDTCGKRFTLKQNLRRHQLTHTAWRLFECDNCGKRFMRKHRLQSHQLTHAPVHARSSGGGGKQVRSPPTAFLPKQEDYLFQQYKLDRFPAQEHLEAIASHTHLKPRVVEVWFQNARARERKGTLNVAWQSIRKRCPVCRRRIYRCALEIHLAMKHADMFSRGEINIDTLADTNTESDGDSEPMQTRPSGGGGKQVRSPPTAFLPKQEDYLFQQYELDRYPAHEQLEAIASRTGLKLSVVQSWFQNARARERKGKLNVAQQPMPSIRQRCPICRLQFYRSMLESHLATKHADKFSRGKINIDTLADTDTERNGDSEPVGAMSASAVTVSLGAAESSRSELRAALDAPDRPNVCVGVGYGAERRNFVCDKCGKGFPRKSRLRQHKKCINFERPFECAECGKRFRVKQQLRNHQVLHTGERPFACNDCGKRFMHSATLIAHCRSDCAATTYNV